MKIYEGGIVMKRIFFIVVVTLFFISCNKWDLGPCEQIYDSQKLPELSNENYNSCDDVLINFCYMNRFHAPQKWFDKYDNNPYKKNIGDTVRVTGYIGHFGWVKYWEGKWTCTLCDDSTGVKPEGIDIQGADTTLLKGVDLSKKCYVVSTITFEPYISVENTPPLSDKSCHPFYPYFNVVEIKN